MTKLNTIDQKLDQILQEQVMTNKYLYNWKSGTTTIPKHQPHTPMTQAIIIQQPDIRHEQLIIRSPDHTRYQVIAQGTRRQLLKYAEQNKVAVRNIRRDAMDDIKKLKKDNAISEDDEKRFENEIQKLTDEAVKKIDDLFAQKEKDILQV